MIIVGSARKKEYSVATRRSRPATTMIIATIYQMLKSQAAFSQDDYVALGIGLVVSFAVAWAVIAAFLTYVQRHSLSVFAYYRMVLGVIVLLVVR